MTARHLALKPRQRAFVAAVAGGASLAEAARQADYAPRSARQTGSALMKQTAIVAAVERRRQGGYTGEPPITSDPIVFLTWCMNDPEFVGMSERIKAASVLMAYRRKD